ncbi:hypothetical protein GCM10017744_040890 [Streptomyces antimycoticus]|uniref:Uncharacterized protein n=1 Tax=Streptomyces antimycoticus TaxID=68175 RepID=A0A4D4KEP4_9ACTN|nr:hypothetical protein SANT12839_061620 [Streptomyces antimycoticus]
MGQGPQGLLHRVGERLLLTADRGEVDEPGGEPGRVQGQVEFWMCHTADPSRSALAPGGPGPATPGPPARRPQGPGPGDPGAPALAAQGAGDVAFPTPRP